MKRATDTGHGCHLSGSGVFCVICKAGGITFSSNSSDNGDADDDDDEEEEKEEKKPPGRKLKRSGLQKKQKLDSQEKKTC